MDFALILFIALIVTGVISLWDRLMRRSDKGVVDGQEKKGPLVDRVFESIFFP